MAAKHSPSTIHDPARFHDLIPHYAACMVWLSQIYERRLAKKLWILALQQASLHLCRGEGFRRAVANPRATRLALESGAPVVDSVDAVPRFASPTRVLERSSHPWVA